MGSQLVLRGAEAVMKAFSVACLITVLAYALFASGIGLGLPDTTPKWIWQAIRVTPLSEDIYGPSVLTRSTLRSDHRLAFALDKEIATSMLEPGVEQDPDDSGYVDPNGVSIKSTGTFRADLYDLGWWPPVILATISAAAALALAAFWWIAASLVRSARTGPPFTTRNARRLLALGVFATVGPTLWNVTSHLVDRALLSNTAAGGRFVPVAEWWQVPNYSTIAIGLVLLTLAAIWRRGVALEEDVEGLV